MAGPSHEIDDKVLVEIWKKVVDVQQHFNDIELRIRNFALALIGAFLAVAGYTAKENDFVEFFGFHIAASALIVGAAILPLAAFYFMDKYWYHRLLDGAVREGADSEDELRKRGYIIHLGSKISEASPVTNRFYGKKIDTSDTSIFPQRRMHSRHKMDVFYGVLFIALVLMSISLGVGLNPPKTNSQEPHSTKQSAN
jgi:hypothetical protein